MTELTARTPPDHVAETGRVICHHHADEPGPTLIAVGGLHGNEPAGILAALAINDNLIDSPLQRGDFVALRGNLAALAINPENPANNPRYIERDLNRLFTVEDDHAATPDHEQRDALRKSIREIATQSQGDVVLIDLHTTSSDSPPFVAVEDALPARRLAERFALPLILGLEEVLPGLLMDDTTRRLGAVALVVEGGRHDDPASVHTLEAVLHIALESLGLLPPGVRTSRNARPVEATRSAAGPQAHRVYDFRHREPIRDMPYESNPMIRPFDRVRAGRDRVATQAGTDIYPPCSGRLFMPNQQLGARVGDDAYFIVQPVGRAWLAISAQLRRSDRLHRFLPRVLPGVRHRPGHPHDLLVDPNIATILRRELFHLLGYRLVRFHADPPRPRLIRALRAVALTLHACAHIAANLCSRRSTDANPTNTGQSDQWIVRRHKLDTKDDSNP